MRKDITYRITENNCWECTSHKRSTDGYFTIFISGKAMKMHRYMYIQSFGEIKEGNLIRHTCDNRQCINPDHLLQGTYADNAQDRDNRNRTAKGTSISLSKLSEQQILEIRNSNGSAMELGPKYNVTPTTIRDIRRNKTWKHITN